ncbi:hypothetical protein ACIA8K_39315 [Catenuloplanes sp. NPDC051500]|uniref:hypothetical protein n=1 Tax=Catenuloplanes sp. NPDC051500 TaxID=3363959 RepID=UPI0037BAE31C
MIVRYLRARRVPAALLLSAGAVALVTALWTLFPDGPVYPVLAVLTTALAMAPLVPTLAGNDAALEATAALPLPPRRLAHLLACAVIVVALLYAGRVAGVDFGTAGQLARNAAGLTGLVGLAAAVFGAGYAWQLPIGWAAVQCVVGPGNGDSWRAAAVWMLQRPDNRGAAVTAALFLVTGLAAYALRVGPTTAASEASAQP